MIATALTVTAAPQTSAYCAADTNVSGTATVRARLAALSANGPKLRANRPSLPPPAPALWPFVPPAFSDCGNRFGCWVGAAKLPAFAEAAAAGSRRIRLNGARSAWLEPPAPRALTWVELAVLLALTWLELLAPLAPLEPPELLALAWSKQFASAASPGCRTGWKLLPAGTPEAAPSAAPRLAEARRSSESRRALSASSFWTPLKCSSRCAWLCAGAAARLPGGELTLDPGEARLGKRDRRKSMTCVAATPCSGQPE
jgi:hypothetical protein